MIQEILILQAIPRIEIVFYEDELEVLNSGKPIIEKIKFSHITRARFIKGRIPWFTGMITSVIDLISGHGAGHWKRGKGKLVLKTKTHTHTIELENYDREQAPRAETMICQKSK